MSTRPSATVITGPTGGGAWAAGFQSLETENHEPVELELTGRLPSGLSGKLLRIGPARLDVYGERFRHWFDGDGMVHELTLRDGKVFYRNRYVETAAKAEEDEARRRIFGGFGTRPAGGMIARYRHRFGKNPANTNIISFGGKLLALCEGGRPHRLDPVTLDTVGEEDWGGMLEEATPFSAHPKIHLKTGELWNFGVRYGREPLIHLYRCPAGGKAHRAKSIPLPFMSIVHDFALTERHAIFVIPPLRLPRFPLGLLSGFRSLADSLRWDPTLGFQIAVVSLSEGTGKDDVRWIKTDARMMFHTIQAWDEGEKVVLDICEYADAEVMKFLFEVMQGRIDHPSFPWPTRYEIDRDGGLKRHRLSETQMEFPRVAATPRAMCGRKVFGVGCLPGEGMLGALVSVDLETGKSEVTRNQPGEYLGEPIPVPKAVAADTGESWLLTLALNRSRERTELRIYDSADLATPPVATAMLPFIVPFGFHGNWIPV